jgi:hypothetical protein
MHHLEIRDPDQVDDEVAKWLRDAYDAVSRATRRIPLRARGALLTRWLLRGNEDGGQWPRSGSRPSAGSSSDSGRCQGSELLAGSSSIACTGVSVGCAGS